MSRRAWEWKVSEGTRQGTTGPRQGAVLCRISGLPTRTMETFGDPAFPRQIGEGRRVEKTLGGCRTEITDRLYDLIGSSPGDLRHFYLAVRRDCHNARSLDRHRDDPHWSTLCEHLGEELDRLEALEARSARGSESYRRRYRRVRNREVETLFELAREPGFRRGLALASPVLAARLQACRGDAETGRRRRKMAMSLARYASRAALKLSPFSSLTRLGLGSVRPEGIDAGGGSPIELSAADWTERAVLRLHRHLIDQCVEVLGAYPPFRDRLEVRLNDTSRRVGETRFRCLRPDFWVYEGGSGLRYLREAWVTSDLQGALIDWLRTTLETDSRTFGRLVEAACRELAASPDPERIAAILGALRRRGFLCILPPWPVTEPWPERALLEELLTLDPSESLDTLLDPLGRLVELQRSFAGAQEPELVLEELEERFRELWGAATALGGAEDGTEPETLDRGSFYEDAFLVAEPTTDRRTEPADTEPGGEIPGAILSVGSQRIESLLEATRPVLVLSHLFHPGLDFRTAVADFVAQRWPDRREIGLLDLFEEMRPVFREFQRFRTERREDDPPRTFDPWATRRAGALRSWRRRLWCGYETAVEPGRDEDRLDAGLLHELVSELPAAYRPPVGACLMVQPADGASGRWVLNRLFEGTGRYGSRYTPVMPEESRGAYLGLLSHRGGGPRSPALLDLLWVQGDNLGVHDLYTAAVLERPGTVSGTPETGVRLGDLHVRWSGGSTPESFPEITDRAGRLLLPVHLGGASFRFLPSVLRFLGLFGPGEIVAMLPPAEFRERGDLLVRNRLSLGDVVLRRRSWSFRPADLRERLEGLSDAEAFAEIHRWRTERALPRRVFLIERVRHEHLDEVYKPQYLDFLSPLFVELFRSALKTRAERLSLKEALPDLDQMIATPRDDRWAVELQVDALALGGVGRSSVLATVPEVVSTSSPTGAGIP